MVKANNTQKYRVGKNKYLKRLNLEKVDKARKEITSSQDISQILGRYQFYRNNNLPKELNDMIELYTVERFIEWRNCNPYSTIPNNSDFIDMNTISNQYTIIYELGNISKRKLDNIFSSADNKIKASKALREHETLVNSFSAYIEVPVWRSPRNN